MNYYVATLALSQPYKQACIYGTVLFRIVCAKLRERSLGKSDCAEGVAAFIATPKIMDIGLKPDLVSSCSRSSVESEEVIYHDSDLEQEWHS